MGKSMIHIIKRCACLFVVLCFCTSVMADDAHGSAASENSQESQKIDVKEIVFSHLGDAYEWHIATVNGHHISIPLPVIVKGQSGEWNIFLSSAFHHSPDGKHNGFYISKQPGMNSGRVVEIDAATGEEVRPLDLSLTKNAASIIIASILMVVIVLSCARWAKRNPNQAPRGFTGLMEMFIMDINDNVIKSCIGPKYKKFAPYLLTVFFFIFINNILGLIPIFPGGANVTGNLSITFVLAMCTFIAINFFGSKEYYKDIIWPHVPGPMKIIMIPIEIIGLFTKPFALMLRLFANIMAGHSIILCLISLIFIAGAMGAVMCTGMTIVSMMFSIFMNVLECLVAYIQAYVFTMLSAVFIGMAVSEPEPEN